MATNVPSLFCLDRDTSAAVATCPGHCTITLSMRCCVAHWLATSLQLAFAAGDNGCRRRSGKRRSCCTVSSAKSSSLSSSAKYSSSSSSLSSSVLVSPFITGHSTTSLSKSDDEVIGDEDAEDIFNSEDDEEEEQQDEEEEEQGEQEDEEENNADVMNDPGNIAQPGVRERVEELSRLKGGKAGSQITVDDLASLFSFAMDKFQRFAVEAFLRGSSVVVCAPTSSGKTLIAECAAAVALARRARIFYTTPLKALSNQKLYDFRNMFGDENVGLITGDASVKIDAPILIMTTEILRNMLYQSVGIQDGTRLQNVCAIVLDEIHYLSDISRGTVWEETVIYCPPEIQLICLSATIANPDELAGWIAQVHGPTELITSRRRPVPLTWHFSTRHCLLPLLNRDGTMMNRGLSLTGYQDDNSMIGKNTNRKATVLNDNLYLYSKKSEASGKHQKERYEKIPVLSDDELQFLRRRQVPKAEETLRQLNSRKMLPGIWFIFSRRGCDTAIKQVEHIQLLSDAEQTQVYEALMKLRKDCPDAVRETAIPALLHGFASHHAGCLPLWKAFIENLFQKGLIKLVFATETLAAGINMPARTTVLASLSKRGHAGHGLLSSNAMLQMAGRAGRRGLDEHGHVVLVQTPFEGAEEGCKLLFAGPDPLVSQFTASYGMVLNLLSCLKSSEGNLLRQGRTLEEARALIEKSFGNYVGSDVKMKAMQHVSKLEEKIASLQSEELADRNSKLSKKEIKEYLELKEILKGRKQMIKTLRVKLERAKLNAIQLALVEALMDSLPFICLRYNGIHSRKDILISAVCVGAFADRASFIQKVIKNDSPSEGMEPHEKEGICDDLQLYVALGSDNSWYLFSATSVQKIFKSGIPCRTFNPDVVDAKGALLEKVPYIEAWQTVGKSGILALSSVWSSPSSFDTWSWSSNVPALGMRMESVELPEEIVKLEHEYIEQRRSAHKIKQEMKATKASQEKAQASALDKFRIAKISRLQKKRSHILARVSRMQPSGWPEFLQVVKVLEETNAIAPEKHEMQSLGQIAAVFRGINELWLAVAFSTSSVSNLAPAQLAAVCASFVSEGIKLRGDTRVSEIYKPSTKVEEAICNLREKQQWLLEIQNKYEVLIPCELDDQLAGIVEAWASGVTWKELMNDCSVDEGDLARLLRRSIDLLTQLQGLPNISSSLHKTAMLAASVADRSPISELIA